MQCLRKSFIAQFPEKKYSSLVSSITPSLPPQQRNYCMKCNFPPRSPPRGRIRGGGGGLSGKYRRGCHVPPVNIPDWIPPSSTALTPFKNTPKEKSLTYRIATIWVDADGRSLVTYIKHHRGFFWQIGNWTLCTIFSLTNLWGCSAVEWPFPFPGKNANGGGRQGEGDEGV